MSEFWSWFVILLTVGTIIGCVWLLQAQSRRPAGSSGQDTTGHIWDRDLTEYNKPLPRWWLLLYWVTAIFGGVYLVLYPGLGTFHGIHEWTQIKEYENERSQAEARYGNVFRPLADIPLADLAANADAVRLGRNLFLNNCATCHGSDARGARGIPNLADGAWLQGNAAATIEATITTGRTSVMPAFGAAIGESGVDEVVAYLKSLARDGNAAGTAVDAGQQKYQQYCVACHGVTAQGIQAIGAPDLTDDDWLHGRAQADIRDVIMRGRINQMPAQNAVLSPDQIRVLVAYVLSLSRDPDG